MRDILRIILRLSWFQNIDLAYCQQNNAFKISQAFIFAQWRDDLRMDKQIVWCSSPPQHHSQFVSDACVAGIESSIFSDDRKIHSGKANIAKERWSEMSPCISYWFHGEIPANAGCDREHVGTGYHWYHGFLTGDESHQGDESYQGYVWSGGYLDPSPGARFTAFGPGFFRDVGWRWPVVFRWCENLGGFLK